jgi:uncharacterized protein YigA (DUF484 family)
MSERAEARNPREAAAEAVKTYIRLNRETLSADGELLALLLPENASLRAERDGLKGAREQVVKLGEAVRLLVLDLLDARSFDEAIATAVQAAARLGADRVALCVEGEGAAPKNCEGVRMIAPGTSAALLGESVTGAVLAGGGAMFLGAAGRDCRSVAVFRLRAGREAPALLYVLGARQPGRFEDGEEADLAFFACALERSFRAWLDLPRA